MITPCNDNCLREVGYDVLTVPNMRRTGPVRDAVARSGIARVMMRLRYQADVCKNPFAKEDLDYMIATCPLRLRYFGYSVKKGEWLRRMSLAYAVEAYGIDNVLERFENIASSRMYEYPDVIKEDMYTLMEMR